VDLLKNAFKNKRLSVMAFVESNKVRSEVISMLNLQDESFASRIVIKPLEEWTKVQMFSNTIDTMLKEWKGNKDTPETFDSKYVTLNLSKIDAILLHARAVHHAKNHIWIDGGFRWDTSRLIDGVPNWPENKLYFSETKPDQLMGGVFGGSISSLIDFNEEIMKYIPHEIINGIPFTDQTVYRHIAKKYPYKFILIPLYSRGLLGNYLFGSAFLESMLPAMVDAKSWKRPWLAKSEILTLTFMTIAVLYLLKNKLIHKRS